MLGRPTACIDIHFGPIRAVVNVHHHVSRPSLRRPQCLSLRSVLNSRTTFRFKARMMLMRVNGRPGFITMIIAFVALSATVRRHLHFVPRPTGRHPRRPPEAGWRDRGWRGSARAVAIERGLRRPYFFLSCSAFSQSRRIGRLGWQSRPSCGRDFSGPGLRPRFAARPANDGIPGPDGGSILRCPRYHSTQR
jgi:hypothetical protein